MSWCSCRFGSVGRRFREPFGIQNGAENDVFGGRKAFQDGLGHHVAFVAFSRRAGNAKIRFSYHRGAIFEGATARPKEAENRTKMIQKWHKNATKMCSKKRSRSRSKTVRKIERF